MIPGLDDSANRLLFVILLLTVGCVGGEVDPRPGSGLLQSDLELRESNGSFEINGSVDFDLAVDQSEEFTQVMVCAYDQNGTLVGNTDIGTFTTPSDSAEVEMELDGRPRYILVEHPKFYAYDELSRVIIDFGERREIAARPEKYMADIDYQRPTEAGECGSAG